MYRLLPMKFSYRQIILPTFPIDNEYFFVRALLVSGPGGGVGKTWVS
jgi:hypothetical protein